MSVVQAGSGRPVLLIHGHDGTWAGWLPTIAPLAGAGHRVIAFDLPGFGASPMPSGPVTIEAYAAAAAQLLERLEAAPAAVVGHSMGGAIAAQLALDRPDLVGRLVLVAPGGLSDRYFGVPTRWLASARAEALSQRVAPRMAYSERRAARVAGRPRARRAALRQVAARPDLLPAGYVHGLLRAAGSPASAAAGAAHARHSFGTRLGEIAAPALIVWGTADRAVPAACVGAWMRAVPHARVVLAQGAGHLPMAERPGWFSSLLEGFLSEPAS